MKQKTATRQLIEYCDYLIDDWGVQGDGVSYILDIKKKAKELESVNEQQIKDAYFYGSQDAGLIKRSQTEYFNETFEKQ